MYLLVQWMYIKLTFPIGSVTNFLFMICYPVVSHKKRDFGLGWLSLDINYAFANLHTNAYYGVNVGLMKFSFIFFQKVNLKKKTPK